MSFDCTANLNAAFRTRLMLETMLLLDASGKIYIIKSEFQGDDVERERVAT